MRVTVARGSPHHDRVTREFEQVRLQEDRSMRRLLRVAATSFLLAVVLGVPGAPAALASCAGGSGPSGSPVIFAGSAQEERRGFTRFSINEVWAGPALAPEVWVQSGQEQARWPFSMFMGVESSTDADFIMGESYVVGASAGFVASVCSVEELSPSSPNRPEQPRAPVADGAEGADPPIGPVGQGLWIAGVLTTIAATIALLRRRSGRDVAR